MPNTIIDSKGKSKTETITGTPALYIVGPPSDRLLYGGNVQGVYSVTTGTSYRWIHDEQRPGGSGPRTGFAAK